jgi:hypothetical protein
MQTRRDFLVSAALTGDWQFFNELKRELRM